MMIILIEIRNSNGEGVFAEINKIRISVQSIS